MTNLVTRAAKGAALTHAEMDDQIKRDAQTKSANYTVVEADNRSNIEVTATATITLPDAATIVAAADTGDFEVTITHVGGTVTVGRTTGTDTIGGVAGDFTVSDAESVTLKVNNSGNGYNITSGNTRNGTETLTNKTLNTPTVTSPVINASVSGTAFKDEDNMVSDSATAFCSQQSIKAYVDNKFVPVNPPEQLTASLIDDAWTSSSGFTSTTLSSNNAITAIIRIVAQTDNSTDDDHIAVHLRKAGESTPTGDLTQIGVGQAIVSSGTHITYVHGESTVALDASSDFEYRLETNGQTMGAGSVVLVGYYV